MHKIEFQIKVCGALIVLCAAAACVSATETIWSADSKSPDGLWVATARTDQTSGPGINSVYNEVSLRNTSRSTQTETIAVYNADSTRSHDPPKLEWIGPTHLLLSFQCTPTMDTQVVKYAGVEISFKETRPCSDQD